MAPSASRVSHPRSFSVIPVAYFHLVAAAEWEQNPDTKEIFMIYDADALAVVSFLISVSDSLLLKEAVLFDLGQFKMLKW